MKGPQGRRLDNSRLLSRARQRGKGVRTTVIKKLKMLRKNGLIEEIKQEEI